MAASLALILRNDFVDLARAQTQIDTFLAGHDTGPDRAYIVRLVVEELVSNVIRYAYTDKAGHPIEVLLDMTDRAIDVTIVDDGAPFDPSKAPVAAAPAAPEEMAFGGRGLSLVREMAGPISYERANGRNRVSVSIRQ